MAPWGRGPVSQYLNTNRTWWSERVPIHAQSPFYDLEGFMDGELSLMPLEQRELGDVVNAVTSAGLRIISLHEFPYARYQMFPFLVQDDVGWWRMKEPDKGLAMTFSMKATR